MNIWLCWFQGEQDSSLSGRDKECIKRWRAVAGQHNVVVLDHDKIEQILPEYNAIIESCSYDRSFQHKADLLRLLLLEKFGGIWADTSVYPLATADEIIRATTATNSVFFYSFSGKRVSAQKGDRLIANWFMIATEPDQYAIQALTSEYKNRFLAAKRWRYFEMHQAYCDLIDTDERFRASIQNMAVLPAESALVLGRTNLRVLRDDQIERHDQPTLMVKKPAPISLARLPCIDPKTPVKTIIRALKKTESLQSTDDFHIIPKPITNETIRYLNTINKSKGILTPSLQAKGQAIHRKLLSLDPAHNSKSKKIAYLHIGKCAGTTLYDYFKNKNDSDITYLHMKRVELNEAADYEFVFFIRHPISRFVSAFNHTKRIVEFDTSKLDINQLNHDNSYAPKRIKRKMLRGGIAFSKKYDQLTRHFKNANELAESLFCDNSQQRRKAQKLMSLPNEHLFKSIGWYLHNGELIKRFSHNIKFVGCVETIDQDLEAACSLFKLNGNPEQISRKRAGLGNQQSQLSSTAIQNLRRWYRDTDYKAIQLLHEHGLIQRNIRDYYQASPYEALR